MNSVLKDKSQGFTPGPDGGQLNPFEQDAKTEPLTVDALRIPVDVKSSPGTAADSRWDPTFIPDTPRELLNKMTAAPLTLAEFCSIDDASIPAGVLQGDKSNKDIVWEDTSNCALCGLVFGLIDRRHHCRICGKSVCGNCSPNSAQLQGMKGLQRVCTSCIEDAEKAPVARKRMSLLGKRLFTAVGKEKLPHKCSTDTLEQATTFCEQVLAPLEELREALAIEKQRADQLEIQVERERQAKQQLEAKAQAAREHYVHVGDLIYIHSGTKNAPTAPALGSLDDAMAFCDAALKQLHVRFKALEKLELRTVGSCTTDAGMQTEDVGLESPAEPEDDDPTTVIQSEVSKLDISRLMSSLPDGMESYVGETSHCSVCFASLGKRFLNPRHHCRICEKPVCSTCSPSNVQLCGMKGLQRACTPCVSVAQAAPMMTNRLMKLGGELHDLAQSARATPAGGICLDDSVAFCEEAIIPLRITHARHEEVQHLANLARQELETRAQSAKDTSQQLSDCLQSLKNTEQADPNCLSFWSK